MECRLKGLSPEKRAADATVHASEEQRAAGARAPAAGEVRAIEQPLEVIFHQGPIGVSRGLASRRRLPPGLGGHRDPISVG